MLAGRAAVVAAPSAAAATDPAATDPAAASASDPDPVAALERRERRPLASQVPGAASPVLWPSPLPPLAAATAARKVAEVAAEDDVRRTSPCSPPRSSPRASTTSLPALLSHAGQSLRSK